MIILAVKKEMVRGSPSPGPVQAVLGSRGTVAFRWRGRKKSHWGSPGTLVLTELRASPCTWQTSERQGFGGVSCFLVLPYPSNPECSVFHQVLPIIVFFSCVMSILYYMGLMQWVILKVSPQTCVALLSHQLPGSQPCRIPAIPGCSCP